MHYDFDFVCVSVCVSEMSLNSLVTTLSTITFSLRNYTGKSQLSLSLLIEIIIVIMIIIV